MQPMRARPQHEPTAGTRLTYLPQGPRQVTEQRGWRIHLRLKHDRAFSRLILRRLCKEQKRHNGTFSQHLFYSTVQD